jgi:GNAT superfamily N-acetyltransferase
MKMFLRPTFFPYLFCDSLFRDPSGQTMHEDFRKGTLCISTDPARLDLELIHHVLSHAYWSEGIPRSIVEQGVRHSLCFGVYDGERQIGFARVITDYTTFGYLCDVFVLEEYRGKGVGTWLMSCIMNHPRLQGFRRWHLLTRDAHELYRKFGFTEVQNPERHMEIAHPDIYKGLRREGGHYA